MFLFAFLFVALPAALVVAAAMRWTVRKFRLIPEHMSFGWLLVPTVGLAAGGAMMLLQVEEFVTRPITLQNELVGRQLVTPLSLRSYSMFGFRDPVWTWDYEIDSATAARLSRDCRPNPDRRERRCEVGGTLERDPGTGHGRAASVTMEGTRLTLEEAGF